MRLDKTLYTINKFEFTEGQIIHGSRFDIGGIAVCTNMREVSKLLRNMVDQSKNMVTYAKIRYGLNKHSAYIAYDIDHMHVYYVLHIMANTYVNSAATAKALSEFMIKPKESTELFDGIIKRISINTYR